MGKYVVDLPTSDPAVALERVEDYLAAQGFVKLKNVWKRTSKLVLSPEYIVLRAGDGHIHMEAWIKVLTPVPGFWVKKGDPRSDAPVATPTKERMRPLLDRIEHMVK
jgi:hypothetical protein